MGNCFDKCREVQGERIPSQDDPTVHQIQNNWQENSPIGNMHRTVISQKRPLMKVIAMKSNNTPSTFSKSSSMTRKNTEVVSPIKQSQKENVAVETKKSLLNPFTINDNETGHDYETILAPFFDSSVKNLTVEDPNICAFQQIINFFRFCEMAVKHCRNLKSICLVTCEAENKSKKKKTGKQNSMFDDIALGLKEHGVEFTVKYEVTIHLNTIRVDSRLVIHIDRGLNIFKSVNTFCIGYHDYTQRKCFNSVIEIVNNQGSNDIGFASQEISKAAKNRSQKVLFNPQKNMHPVQIKISDGETGYDYESIIVGYLDSCIKVVNVEDPYIISYHQIINFFRFCEVVVKHCPNLENICLVTCPGSAKNQQIGKFVEQVDLLNDVCKGLNESGVNLQVVYEPTLHDREIRFDNGWTIKIGKGLDFFKSTKKLHIGTYDYTQRKCHQTTINIFEKLNP